MSMKRIRIKNITDEDDKYLNGLTGVLTAPFGCFPFGEYGVWLDDETKNKWGICNIEKDEFEVIE